MNTVKSAILAGIVTLMAVLVGSVQAEDIDFTHITILDSSPRFNASFDVSNLATNHTTFPETDGFGYASQGAGANTFVDFEFDQPYSFGAVTMVDRLHSGAAQDVLGGLFDFVENYDLIFSLDSTFDDDDFVISVENDPPELPAEDFIGFLSNAAVPNVTAQYIRYDVVLTNGVNPGAHTFFFDGVLPSGVDADFDNDGQIDIADIDLLYGEFAAGTNNGAFDLDGNGLVDNGDLTAWLSEAGAARSYTDAVLLGDTDLNGKVDAADLNNLGVNWQANDATSWSQGDFNHDQLVNAQDLNDLGINWLADVRPAAAAVPEPATWLLLAGMAVLTIAGRRPGKY
jgi:hypothetical protein